MPRLFLRVLKNKFFIYAATSLCTIMLVAGGFYLTFLYTLHTPASLKESVVIHIKPGESLRSIARQLYQKRLIKSPIAFEIYLRFQELENKLQAGEYLFEPNSKSLHIIDKMTKGEVLLHPVLIVEGLTSQQILQSLNDCDLLTGTLKEPINEGTLLPETYYVPRGASRTTLVAQMRRAHQELVDQLWLQRDPSLPYKTREEAVIMASIIEKETPLSHEKPHVAAVFLNRLKKGMRLQADPTVIYGLYQQTGEMVKALSREQLGRQSEFNTYIKRGLPPTAICHPGAESIRAAFNPLKTNALYFVADGSGGHVFAQTYEEHRLNHQKWRKIRGTQEQ